MKVKILDVEIDDITEKEFLLVIEKNLQFGKKIFVATPNPEMLVLSKRDEKFRQALQGADIKIPDGIGLQFGATILGKKIHNRITGADMLLQILRLAETLGLSTYFLGGRDGIAKEAALKIKEGLPNLNIVGTEEGSRGEAEMDKWDNKVILEHINSLKPDILFVALGHGKQEKWISKNLAKIPSVKLAMGVGGAFDFYAGKIRRAPDYVQIVGLEWLWRLIKEPSRYKRIFNAVIVFPLVCFISRFKKTKSP